jgi:hypothetical protein
MRRIPFILLFCGLAAPVAAQEPPACSPAREGTLACLSGKLCACRFIRGGSLTGQRDRHAWDCGILRPACGAGLVPPGLVPQGQGSSPPMPPPGLFLQVPDRRER